MEKLWKIAKIVRGNKKDFEPNILTIAIAAKQAEKDFKKEMKKINLKN